MNYVQRKILDSTDQQKVEYNSYNYKTLTELQNFIQWFCGNHCMIPFHVQIRF